jgi:serine/threonine protein kinase
MVHNEATVTLASGPRVGDLLGDYRLTGLLGEGGMAKVFAAEHLSGGQRVAIKVLSRDRSASSTASRSFALEALAAQRIAHPNVIEIVASGEDADHKYHVMQHVNGVSLRDLMEDADGMSVPHVLAIARQIASALAAAHAAGIVHRDLKPENVMVEETNGRVSVKLIDFGAAKDLSAPTIVGETIVGTPIYMAPEQMWGQQTSAATDVYAFGLLVYEMLAGKLPFKARKFVELREERSTQEPTPLRVSLVERLRTARARAAGPAPMMRETVPAELEALIMTCLARSPDERPASMLDICARLANLDSAGRAPQTRTVQPTARIPRPTRPQRRLRHAVGYAAAMLAVFVSAGTLFSDVNARGPYDGAIIVASR